MVPNMVDPGLIWGRVIAGLCFQKASQAPENGFIGTSELFRRNRFASRDARSKFYPDRKWFTVSLGGDYQFIAWRIRRR
jgi:hypothetical protein